MPLPAHPQRYYDLASLSLSVPFAIFNLLNLNAVSLEIFLFIFFLKGSTFFIAIACGLKCLVHCITFIFKCVDNCFSF